MTIYEASLRNNGGDIIALFIVVIVLSTFAFGTLHCYAECRYVEWHSAISHRTIKEVLKN
jgi:hypothetical protein